MTVWKKRIKRRNESTMTYEHPSLVARKAVVSARKKGDDFGDSKIGFGLVDIEEMAGHPISNIDYVLEDVSMQLGTKVTLKTRLCTKAA